jgi:hypothetical protein
VAANLGDSPSRVQVKSQSVEREGLQAVNQLRVAETCSWGRGQFGDPEEGECLPLEAATKQYSEDHDWEYWSLYDSDL